MCHHVELFLAKVLGEDELQFMAKIKTLAECHAFWVVFNHGEDY